MQPLLDLKKLCIVSECRDRYLIQLSSAALNIEHLVIGSSTNIDDETVTKILTVNRLAKLNELRIAGSRGLTIHAIHLLLESCPNLRVNGS